MRGFFWMLMTGALLAMAFYNGFAEEERGAGHPFHGAKLEPEQGGYSGAGQGEVAVMQQVMNLGAPDHMPHIITYYPSLPGGLSPIVLHSHNFFPGAIINLSIPLPMRDPERLEQWAGGEVDPHIRRLASRLKEFDFEVLLRLGYEFDLPHHGYPEGPYIRFFRRFVRIMREEGADEKVAFVWNATTCTNRRMMSWYPGDDYVDWFSFNVFTNHFDPAWFMETAREHGKPVFIGELSNMHLLASDDTWITWLDAIFPRIRASGIKGHQYINRHWSVYGMWRDHHLFKGDSRITAQSAAVRAHFQAELRNPYYLHRDGRYHNALGLYVHATRDARGYETINDTPWDRAHDVAALQEGYDYQVVGHVVHHYGDDRGNPVHWRNAEGERAIRIALTVPPGRPGNLVLNLQGEELEVYLGQRPALALSGRRFCKIPFTGDAVQDGVLRVTAVTRKAAAVSGDVQVYQVGIQAIAPDAPARPAPPAAQVNDHGRVELRWNADDRAALYNIYRDQVLIGASREPRYTDPSPLRQPASYSVSAWHERRGESLLSEAVRVHPAR